MRRVSEASSKAILYAILNSVGDISDSSHENLVNKIHKLCIDFALSNSRLPSSEELAQILEKLPKRLFANGVGRREKFTKLLSVALGSTDLTFDTATLQNSHSNVERVFLEDIDSFSKAASILPQDTSSISLEHLYEDQVKIALIDIIGERFIPDHSATEKSDLYTSQVILKGQRVPTAFLLKSMRSVKALDMKYGLGKSGNQVLRLVKEPAKLYVVQHTGEIKTDVIEHLEAQLFRKAKGLETTLYYYIMDGNETARILLGFGKLK
ncbi:MAG: hypothetical protein ACFFER_15125 [Candidatus Thorarchaeota archaeon]